jgi:hypothetical protein
MPAIFRGCDEGENCMKCPECSESIPDDALQCDHCNADVRGGAAPEPADDPVTPEITPIPDSEIKPPLDISPADDLEVIFGASSDAEAALVSGLLESAGIASVILDQNLTTCQIVMASAARGYRIAVPSKDRDEANEALVEGGFISRDP